MRLQVENTLRAAQCALELQHAGGRYTCNGVELTLHCALSAGTVHALHVGGSEAGGSKEWEFLLAGQPFADLEKCIELSGHGEVVASRAAFALLAKHASGAGFARAKTSGGEVQLRSSERCTFTLASPSPQVKLLSVDRPVPAALTFSSSLTVQRRYSRSACCPCHPPPVIRPWRAACEHTCRSACWRRSTTNKLAGWGSCVWPPRCSSTSR